MQDKCGATSTPVSAFVLFAVSMVPERVVPPAPNVTEKNAGLSAASGPRAAARFSSPASVLGGNSSMLKTLEYFCCVCMTFPQPPNRTDRTGQPPTVLAKPGGDDSTCIRIDVPTICHACVTPFTILHKTTYHPPLARPRYSIGIADRRASYHKAVRNGERLGLDPL